MSAPAHAAVVPLADRVPVTLITGFLGAGKTTLVNHILSAKGTKRVGVIENEFGEINIDNSLVAANLIEKEDIVSLENGCACCSLRKDVVRALKHLDDRSKKEGYRFDAILLETTGLADPAPIVFTFLSLPWITTHFRLDSILCVVDAQYIVKNITVDHKGSCTVNESAQQIAFGDLVLINKIDIVDKDELALVKKTVRTINRNASIIDCQLNKEDGSGCPAVSEILNVESFSLQRIQEFDPSFMESDSESERDEDRGSSHCVQHKLEDASSSDDDDDEELRETRHPRRKRKIHHDTMGICSIGVTARGPLHQWRFNMFMKDFFSERAEDIFRSKGILCIKGRENTKFVFQGVHDTITYGPLPDPWGDDEERINKIVFIGKNLNRRDVTEALRDCVWTPLPEGWVEYMDKRTKRPVYVNEELGKRQFEIPSFAVAHIEVTSSIPTVQPEQMRPRPA